MKEHLRQHYASHPTEVEVGFAAEVRKALAAGALSIEEALELVALEQGVSAISFDAAVQQARAAWYKVAKYDALTECPVPPIPPDWGDCPQCSKKSRAIYR